MEIEQNRPKERHVKVAIYQKDQFHMMQKITRDVPKEYRDIIIELINKKILNKSNQ